MPTVPVIIAVSLWLAAGAPPARLESSRQPNPFAPSLPLLTDQEEEQFDAIVQRFILSDIGQLKGREAEKAVAEFKALGPEAVFALTRGLNRSANIESSCPALIIYKKLSAQVRMTHDLELLEFLRENVGAGVTTSKHKEVISRLRVECILRKRTVHDQLAQLRTNSPATARFLQTRSIEELVQLAQVTRGEPFKPVLRELEKREGDKTLDGLAKVAALRDKEKQPLAAETLESFLSRQSNDYLKLKLKDERPRVRAAAARVAGDKPVRLGTELIELLLDDTAEVRRAAHQALVKLSAGQDFGPQNDDSVGLRDEAARKWRAWWTEQGGK